jgi:acetylserotonin O-methyltransferase
MQPLATAPPKRAEPRAAGSATADAAGPEPILELIHAFRRSKTMFTAVTLGIFEGDRPPGPGVSQLLDACVSLGLLERRGHKYVNTPVADLYLRRASPASLTGYIRYSDAALFRLWANLDAAVLSGSNQWAQVFGEDGLAVRRAVFGGEDFLRGMHGIGMITSPAVIAAVDLSRYRCLLDLGGATGHLALAARQRYPGLRAIVMDLPPIIEMATKTPPDGIEFLAGDFCVDPLPTADVVALGRILHHRSEERIIEILARLHERLPVGGAVLVIERVIDDENGGSVDAHMHSLNMLLCTDGGRERTFAEYQRLLERAGFCDMRLRITGTPLDVVMAIKQTGSANQRT